MSIRSDSLVNAFIVTNIWSASYSVLITRNWMVVNPSVDNKFCATFVFPFTANNMFKWRYQTFMRKRKNKHKNYIYIVSMESQQYTFQSAWAVYSTNIYLICLISGTRKGNIQNRNLFSNDSSWDRFNDIRHMHVVSICHNWRILVANCRGRRTWSN